MDRFKLMTRWLTVLNRMTFSDREWCEALSSFDGFSLQSTRFSQKLLLIPPLMIFSLLVWISFYVSSRRMRICIHIERNPQISFGEAGHEDIFTDQAMSDWCFSFEEIDRSTQSLESMDLRFERGNRVRWIECRSQIIKQTDQSRAMEDFVFEKLIFQKKLSRSHHQRLSLFLYRYPSMFHRDASHYVSLKRVLQRFRWIDPVTVQAVIQSMFDLNELTCRIHWGEWLNGGPL